MPSGVQALAKGGGSPHGPSPCLGALVQHQVCVPPASAQAPLKKQISTGGALGASSADPAQLPSLREPGAQDPASPQAPLAAQTGGGGEGWVRRPRSRETTFVGTTHRDADRCLSTLPLLQY